MKQLHEKICVLEAAKDSQAMEQVEFHDQELTNSKIIQQLQQDIELLKVITFTAQWNLSLHLVQV